MRTTQKFVPVLVLVLGASVVQPLGAASFVQKCNGPTASTQSGRINLTPGLNGQPARQKLDVRVSLFECSPDRTSRGSGTFKSTFMTKHARACGFLSTTTAFKVKATVIWKNEHTSTLAMTFTVSGHARMVTVIGRVSAGNFKGHKVHAEYHFKPVASPYPTGLKSACANKVQPNGKGRKSVVSLDTFSTKPFVIT
jgi:hypothetical protein